MTHSQDKINLIGLSGKKQSGKDTFCKFLRDSVEHSHRPAFVEHSHRLAFADFLKMEVADACGVTMEFIEMNKGRFRPMLQWWGTDFRRNTQGNDYWIQQLEHAFHYVRNETLVIITDVRFPNEYDFVKSNGGIMVRINKDVCNSYDSHPSETSLDNHKFDFVVDNNGTLQQLKQQADNLINKYGIHSTKH